MTSRTRITAARIAARLALREAARQFAEGTISAEAMQRAAQLRLTLITVEEAERRVIQTARDLVRKSKLARQLNGRGDLWNGDDRAFQFSLLNEAARARRAITLSA